MADKDLDELVTQLGKSARATDALVAAQRAATQAADRFAASIADLSKQALRGATDFDALAKSLTGYAAVAKAAANAHAEIAKVQAPASSALKATEAAAKASAEQLKASRDAAKELSNAMLDASSKIASGENPLKTLADKATDVSKALVKAKIDGADLGGILNQLGGVAGSLAASVLTVVGAQAAQALASKIATASASEAAAANVSLAAASDGAAGALHLQSAAASEAAAKNLVAAETAVAATVATTEATVASRGLGATLLGAVGGPIGLAVGALVLGVGALALAQRDAADSSTAAASASDVSAQAISDLNKILGQDPTPGVTVNIREYTKAQLDRADATYEVARADLMAKKAGAEARLADLRDGVVSEKTGPHGTYRERRLSTAGTRAGTELGRERGAAEAAIQDANTGLTSLEAGFDRTKKAIVAHDRELARAQSATVVHTQAVRAHTSALSTDDGAWSRSVDSSKDFAKALSEEVVTMGLSNEEIRRREIHLQILEAPTFELHDQLVELSDQWEQQVALIKGVEAAQKALAAQQGITLHTMREVIGDGPRVSNIFEDITEALTKNVAKADATRTSIEGIVEALNKNDWTGALGSMVGLLEKLEKAFGKTGTAADKFTALAGVAQGVGGIVGGTGGAAISGAASGALSGFSLVSSLAAAGTVIPGIGNVAGAAIGAVLGGLGSLFGGSSAKKKQREQEAAQRAQEEAKRQEEIANTGRQLEIDLLKAQGKGFEATNKEREAELAKLTALSPALAEQQKAVYAAQLASDQRGLDIELLEAQGKAEAALAMKREDQLNALDPSLRATQQAIFAEEDLAKKRAHTAEVADRATSIQDQIDQLTLTSAELMYAGREKELKAADALDASLGPLLLKLWGLEDAATATAKAAQDAADAQERQQTNIGLMRQLNQMDDDVLGTTSARDASRQDELAKLDDTGKLLQKIVWARQDENEKLAKRTSIQDQIDQFTKSPSELLAASRAKERAEAVKLDASLGKLLDTLYGLQDAAAAAELAAKRMDLKNQILRAIGTPVAVKQATDNERAATLKNLDPSLRDFQAALWKIEDATNAVTEAQQAYDKAMSDASNVYGRVTSEIQANVDKFKGFSDTLKSFRSSLETGGAAMNDPQTQYARTKADFEKVAGLASRGDVDALGRLQGVSEAYLEASKAAQADNIGYFRDLAAVKEAAEAAQAYADQQVEAGKEQLDALERQFTALGVINKSVMSVETAVGNLTATLATLDDAKATRGAVVDTAAALVNNNTPAAPSTSTPVTTPPVTNKPANDNLGDSLTPQWGYNPTGEIYVKYDPTKPVTVNASDSADTKMAKAMYMYGTGQLGQIEAERWAGPLDTWTENFRRLAPQGEDWTPFRRRYGFATGGSFTVGGAGGPDSQYIPLNLTPGEMVNVSRPDTLGALVDEIRGLRADNAALRQEVADLKTATTQTAINTGRQVRLSERWDGDGLPPEREAA